MRYQSLLYGLFAMVLIAAGVTWFQASFELREVAEYTGFRGEARENPLFASRMFLRRMGIDARRHDGLDTLPATDSVLVLDTERFNFSGHRVEQLLDWVRRGGHLITRARVDQDTADDGGSRFGSPPETEDRDLLQQALNIRIGAHHMPDQDQLPFSLQLDGVPETLEVELDFFNALVSADPDTRQYAFDGASWLLQRRFGQGLITFASTLEFVENTALDRAGHARLLWYLLHSHGTPQQVWLVHEDGLPALPVLLAHHAWPLLLMTVLGLALLFWHLIPRFGAALPDPLPERRRISEHVQASGRFYWKQGAPGQRQLQDSLRHSLQAQARRLIPGWEQLDQARQLEALAHWLQWPSAEQPRLAQLLQAESLSESQFTQLATLVHNARNLS